MATAFVDMVGGSMIFPLLPYYALELDAAPWVIGWMVAAFWIAQLAAAPLWGRVSDRYGRRPAILAGLLAAALGYLVFAFAVHMWMLFLSRLVQGAGGGITGVAQAYVGDTIAPKDRARALGWLSAATSAGVMIGPAIGSLATNLGTPAPGLIAATLCLMNVIFAWRMLPESAPKRSAQSQAQQPGAGRRSVFEVVWEVFRVPGSDVPRLIWIYTVGMLGFMSMTGILALYLEAEFAITEKTIGLFFVYVGALGLVMRALILGRLVDRFGETRVMRAGAAALALGLATIPLPTDVITLTIAIALVPIGTALLFPATSALVTHRAPRPELGQVLGVQQAFGNVSRVVAPIWAAAAFQGLGPGVPFFISGAVVAFVGLLSFGVKPADHREDVPRHARAG